MNRKDLEKIINIDKITKTANLNKLDGKQTFDLITICYVYESEKKDLGLNDIQIIKYNTYNSSYFLERIKLGETPFEIMEKILEECFEYEKQQLIKKYMSDESN
jgi:hypothetical protein